MIQVYTGDGKGKTTAAFGLALRAAGAGYRIYICQFIKGKLYSELKSLKKIKRINLEQFGRGCFIGRSPKEKDILLACQGLEKAKVILASHKYKMVILDEINVALKLKLLKLKDVLELLKSAPKDIEVVLTGRYAHPKVLKMADLISEVKKRRHYYDRGIKARKGIEL